MIELRPYQSAAIDQLRANVRAGILRQLLVAPCAARGRDRGVAGIKRTINLKGANMPSKKDRIVVVVARQATGSWARVAYGTLVEQTEARVVLKQCRQALYYARESGGEFGLAAHGPRGECRISAVVELAELYGPGLVMDCSEAAITAWRNAPVFAGK